MAYLYVTLLVARDFPFPKTNVGLWHAEILAIVMSMPKTAIDKDDRAVFPKHDVGMTWQSWMVESVSVSSTEQEFPYNQLGLCVLAVYGCHIGMDVSIPLQ